MTALKSLHDLMIHELQDIANAEQQLTKALPKLAESANDPTLREVLRRHLGETELQLQRVNAILEKVASGHAKVKCAAMEGLLKEGEALMKENAAPEVHDAAIIAAAQKVEHYEIAAYGTLLAWAEQLGLDEAASILSDILEEEKTADEALTGIAMSINPKASE